MAILGTDLAGDVARLRVGRLHSEAATENRDPIGQHVFCRFRVLNKAAHQWFCFVCKGRYDSEQALDSQVLAGEFLEEVICTDIDAHIFDNNMDVVGTLLLRGANAAGQNVVGGFGAKGGCRDFRGEYLCLWEGREVHSGGMGSPCMVPMVVCHSQVCRAQQVAEVEGVICLRDMALRGASFRFEVGEG